tara:strand:+ start:611 stop:871 length:261 start_codon:yes stop_codon:yes gene_type:complete
MNNYTIKEPIWDGGNKTRAIGIADFRIPCIIDISHKNSDGKLSYPGKFKITESDIEPYRIQTIRNSIKLIIIPISDLYEKFKVNNE